MPRPPATVEYFLTECKRYEDLQSKRISHSQLEHLAEATPYNYCKDLIALIRDTVRNELQTFLTQICSRTPSSCNVSFSHGDVHAIQGVIQDQLRSVLHSCVCHSNLRSTNILQLVYDSTWVTKGLCSNLRAANSCIPVSGICSARSRDGSMENE